MSGFSPSSRRSIFVAILAAMGASACCAGPLILLGLGISGSWIGNLSLVEPYRPYLMAITLLFFALAFRRLYLQPQVCATDTPCADDVDIKKQRRVFWIVLVMAVVIIAFPWYAPFLFN